MRTKNRVKTLNKIEALTGLEAALAYNDTVSSIRAVNDTDRLWDALADMLRNGAAAVEYFLGNAKPALTVIRGSAA